MVPAERRNSACSRANSSAKAKAGEVVSPPAGSFHAVVDRCRAQISTGLLPHGAQMPITTRAVEAGSISP